MKKNKPCIKYYNVFCVRGNFTAHSTGAKCLHDFFFNIAPPWSHILQYKTRVINILEYIHE